jgi:hypothetical protein
MEERERDEKRGEEWIRRCSLRQDKRGAGESDGRRGSGDLAVDEVLSFDEHGDEGRGRLDLLEEGEHLAVAQDSPDEVEGGGDAGRKIKGGEFAGKLLMHRRKVSGRGERNFATVDLHTCIAKII